VGKVLNYDSGFPSSYGIFQEYYSANDFVGSSNIAVVGTCAMVATLLILSDRYTKLDARALCI
jgi:hypothetical protein